MLILAIMEINITATMKMMGMIKITDDDAADDAGFGSVNPKKAELGS